MNKGKIKFWNKDKAFGFIIEEGTNKEVFLHITGLIGDYEPQKDDVVFFETVEGKKGLNAVNVSLA